LNKGTNFQTGKASPILEGQLQGPITNPFAIVGVILTNVVWGAVTGLIAAAVQKTLAKSQRIILRENGS
jgi:hypothetical protein